MASKSIGNQSPRYQDISQFEVPEGFRGRSAVVVQLWWIVQATLFQLSPQVFFGWRRFLLRLFGASIGRGVLIRPSVKIVYPWKIKIGDFSWVGDGAVLYSLGDILIGSNTVISQYSFLCTGSHDIEKIRFDILERPIRIGSECWIASDVFVAAGVTIGDGTVVGARSTVLRDLPGGMICYGSPAAPVRPRQPDISQPLSL